MFLLCETAVELFFESLAVEILANENEFYHTVAVFVVPVAEYRGVLLHQFAQFVFGRGGVPVSGLCKFFLRTGLFENIGHVGVVAEIENTLCTYYVRGPFRVDEVVEAVDVEWLTAIINICLNAVFLYFAFAVVVMVVAVVIVMFVVMVVLMFMLVVVIIVIVVALDSVYPCGRCSNLVEVEHAGVENFRQVYVAVVALNDFSFGLQRTDYGFDPAGFVATYFGDFI